MFSKPIFKQSVKSNGKLWLTITIVGSIMLTIFAFSFDPDSISTLASAAKGTEFDKVLSSMTSLLGSMEGFFKMLAVLLGIIYVVFTANNLVVNEVDSGSMAYTLSTPIKRSSVIFTKMTYLISSIILMFTIIGGVGLGATQLKYHNVTGHAITADVREAAEALDRSPRYVSEHLYLIKEDEQAMQEAAKARNMDVEAYKIYLENVLKERSFDQAATVLTDENKDDHGDDDDWSDKEIEVTLKEVQQNPALILGSSDAIEEAADIMGQTVSEYTDFVTKEASKVEQTKNEKSSEKGNASMLLQTAISTGAKALNLESDKVEDNMSLLKADEAMSAATEATQLSKEELTTLINQSMIASAQTVDEALDFDVEAYLWLVLGIILLVLALGSISFFASTLFNRTGSAMALGGGIPIAFFLISIIKDLVDNMDSLKYFTLTTLYNTEEIIAGGEFGWGLASLAIIAAVLYGVSNIIFCKKDLPL